MKKKIKIIADCSIILFAVSLILSKINESITWNSTELRSILIIIYLITSLYYNKMEIKDKDAIIQDLKIKLKNKNS